MFTIDQSSLFLRECRFIICGTPNFISIAIEWWRRAFHFPESHENDTKNNDHASHLIRPLLGANLECWLMITHCWEWCRFHYLSKLHQILSVLRLSDGEERSTSPKSWKRPPKTLKTMLLMCWEHELNVDQSSFWWCRLHYLSRIAPNFISIAIEWWRRAFHFPEIMKTTTEIKTLTMHSILGADWMLINHHFWGVQIHYLSELHQILSVLRLSDGEERSTSPKSWKRHQKHWPCFSYSTFAWSELECIDQSSFWGVQIHYLSELHQILSVLR